MIATRRTVLAAILFGAAILASGPVFAQDKAHWLVGTWVGDIQGMRADKYGPTRYLKVGEVKTDGSLAAGWGVNEPKVGKDAAKLSGDTIELTTSAGSRVELSRVDDANLQGTFTTTGGRTYTIRMKKQ